MLLGYVINPMLEPENNNILLIVIEKGILNTSDLSWYSHLVFLSIHNMRFLTNEAALSLKAAKSNDAFGVFLKVQSFTLRP